MGQILDSLGVDYEIGIDEAAFYGPKLDIQVKNVFGKEDTLITIQIDQLLAEKFGMEYVDRDGTKKHPYIIHRTSIGCYERTLALLIEKYAGEENEKVMLEFTFDEYAFLIKKGEYLRVDIAPTDENTYVCHTNQKGQYSTIENAKTAHNKIFLDESCLILPVEERGKIK